MCPRSVPAFSHWKHLTSEPSRRHSSQTPPPPPKLLLPMWRSSSSILKSTQVPQPISKGVVRLLGGSSYLLLDFIPFFFLRTIACGHRCFTTKDYQPFCDSQSQKDSVGLRLGDSQESLLFSSLKYFTL